MRPFLLLLPALAASGCGSLLPTRDPPGDGPPGDLEPRPRFEDYLRGDRHARLVLEVDAVPGFEPYPEVSDAVAVQLAEVVEKPGGVSVVGFGELESPEPDHAWSFAELDTLATASFDLEVPADTVKMHVLFVDGHHEDDGQDGTLLGLAWAHTHLVIFKETLEDLCRQGLTGVLMERLCQNAEHGVWIHEVGHLLGLVNNGVPMITDHQDEAHGAHDQSQGCVMYWAYDSGTLIDDLRARITGGDESRLQFDAACKADLEAVRER